MRWSLHCQTTRLATTCLAFLALASLATQARAAADTPPHRPNVVLIMADDLGQGSLGCYGSAEVKTPNIDRLAAGGLRCTDFHSSGTVCSPTRAALLTGRYPQRCEWVPDEQLSPVFREQRKQNPAQRWAWGISPRELTIAKVLHQAGYQTALIGKWHLGYDFSFHPLNYGFDEFRGFMGGNVDYHTHVAGYGLKELDWWNGKNLANDSGYTTDLLTRYASEFITRNRNRPFFLYLAHAAPHDPWQGRNQGQKKSAAETYREMIERLDDSVGTIVSTLSAHDLAKNTLVIFCSDNGGAAPRGVPANGRLRGRKGGMHEGGHRVPFIASWPGVIGAGLEINDTVMTMDFFPTFVHLAGAKIPQEHEIDGQDLWPLLSGTDHLPQRTLHWLFGESWAVRHGAWKLMQEGDLALFDLEHDPEEKNNLLSRYPDRVATFTHLHEEWIAKVGRK